MNKGIGFLRAENISGFDKINLSNLNYIDEKFNSNFLKRSILCVNDILITIAGTLGRTAIVKENELPLNTNQAIAIIRLINPNAVDLLYIVYSINSATIKKQLLNKSVEMAIPNLSLDNIATCLIPLAPQSEQRSITEKIEILFSTLDSIEQNFN